MADVIKRRLQLALVLVASAAIASLGGHLITAWLEIETTSGMSWAIGQPNGKPPAVMSGSSLAGDGISWERISAEYDQRIEGWSVAGSSPWEWETFQQRAPDTRLNFLVVSVYDLNEQFISDFHADTVSAFHTVRDLWQSQVDWHFAKRVLSGYPLKYVRILFPSAGRSQGVLRGLREKLGKLLGDAVISESEARPTFAMSKIGIVKEYKTEKIVNWSPARMQRRLATMRGAAQGRQSFDGPKKLAFLRILHQGQHLGRIVVIVLPVSPAYAREFLTPEVSRRFENAVAEAQRTAPQARWVRLDRLRALDSDEYFWDLVHLNIDGQRIATEALLGQLRNLPMGPS